MINVLRMFCSSNIKEKELKTCIIRVENLLYKTYFYQHQNTFNVVHTAHKNVRYDQALALATH